MKMKCLLPITSLLALTMTPALFSDNSGNLDEKSPLAQTNLRGRLQPRSESASVDKGWTADVSFLYWNAKVDGYEFADKVNLTGTSVGGSPTFIDAKGKIEAPSFDNWDPGVQVGLGYIFPQREQWSIHLGWTHLNTDTHRSLSTDDPTLSSELLVPILIPFLTGTAANGASAHWSMDFDTLDLELGRNFYVGKWLSCKPTVGLRAAWIDQHFRVKYDSIYITSSGHFPFGQFFRCNQNFSGIGLRFGTDLQFYIARDWSILGNLSGSLLWGSIDIKEKASGRIFVSATDSFPETINFKQSMDRIRSNLEGSLGFQWQRFYHEDKYRVAISALYSFAYWFRQNQLVDETISFPPNLQQPASNMYSSVGDLQLQGLTLRFNFDF